MVYDFKFPDLGEGIHEGKIVKWLIKQGDKVKEDQILAEIETDKAIVELPSPKTGVIQKINFKTGETVEVGQVILSIKEKGEKIIKKNNKTSMKKKKESVAIVGELPEKEIKLEDFNKLEKKTIENKILALPKVRSLARKLKIDLSKIKGTGKQGRITEQDIEKARKRIQTIKRPIISRDHYGPIIRIPLTNVRKVIKEKMEKSWNKPLAVVMMEADITEIERIRKTKKELAKKKGIKLTILSFIVRATVAALKKHPYMNSHYEEEKEEIINKEYYNIGIAVSTAVGLMVPVIKKADSKSIMGIAHDIEVLAENTRKRKILLEDLKGSTFTITNYGSIGGIFGFALPNYPETGILGVGRAQEKPIIKKDKIIIRKMLPLSLSFDHRVVDGAEATNFLSDLIKHLEDPNLLLLDID